MVPRKVLEMPAGVTGQLNCGSCGLVALYPYSLANLSGACVNKKAVDILHIYNCIQLPLSLRILNSSSQHHNG